MNSRRRISHSSDQGRTLAHRQPRICATSANLDAREAGVPNGGAVLVRPDGFIGFRAAPADETTMNALDAHLATYLVPDAASFQ
jgi:hypothetical protein